MRLSSRCVATIVFALALALGLASTLGFVHRVLHGPAGASRVATTFAAASVQTQTRPGVQAQAAKAPDAVDLRSSLLALFGTHADADCRLYDQLAGGASALTVPLVVLPLVLPTATFDYFRGEALARWVALFQARGPPVTR
ncbi:MAG: hypothetical protein JWQ03_2176 [Variovorax sp.]|nr:hypothetical protein [Variovorax sp.]